MGPVLTACPFGLCRGVTDVPSTVVVAMGIGFGVFTDADLLMFSDSMGGHGNDSIVGVGTFCRNVKSNKPIKVANDIQTQRFVVYVHADFARGNPSLEFEKRSRKLDKCQGVAQDPARACIGLNNAELCCICNIRVLNVSSAPFSFNEKQRIVCNSTIYKLSILFVN